MTATTTRVGEPARQGRWGLTVDNMHVPSEYVVLEYSASGRRHAEPATAVQRVPYAAWLSPETLAAWARMPPSTARWLVTAVAIKLASPKASAAELGWRPIR